MPSARWLWLVALCALSACELVVDPAVGSTTGSGSTGAGGTSAASGSSGAASGTTGSGSTSGSGGGSGSGGTVGTSGGCARTGTTGFAVAGCPSIPPTLAMRADIPVTPVPDSTSTCGTNCAPGTDSAWQFPPDQFCGYPPLAFPDGGQTQFAVSVPTRLAWQVDNLISPPPNLAQAKDACRRWQGASTALPTPWEAIQALDFGLGNNIQAPTAWNPAYLSPNQWAVSNNGTAWRFNYDEGSFSLAADGGTANARCIEHGPTDPTAGARFQCAVSPLTNDPQCALTFGGGPAEVFDESTVLVNYQGALDHCGNLPPCGNWRLPSYKELATLVDFETPTGEGRNQERGTYWTSTLLNGNTVMILRFGDADGGATAMGKPSYLDQNGPHGVICIQNPP